MPQLQINRVATARNISADQVQSDRQVNTDGPDLGILGIPA